ncbi:DUF262 domain-containing protein [Terriglobus tenax]|uniref:DUF262 domain-containing protein n=1 Tax=Terriglobus tenax TaxID=1111115 RepID=UPI0021E02A9E|nr:DUF262 domain-containing protein [Terriglobus tenax]
MKIKQQSWPISKIKTEQQSINLNPIWQRGPTWRAPRQVLLIDSILRGMDIPKVYLRRLTGVGAHKFDAVDGQQRLRAIWLFGNDDLRLEYEEVLSPIDGHPVQNLVYSELHKDLRDRFDNFEVSVAEIQQGSNDDITGLFARLQMGMPLNPAELRNAILSPIRHLVSAIATSHAFFIDSRIPEARYKRQDYASHAFAMAAYEGTKDIKAPDLKAMLREYDHTRADEALELSARVGDALNTLHEVNTIVDSRITQKWIFVDLGWLIMQRQAAGATVDATKLAACYEAFESRRRQFNSEPEALIRGRRPNAALDRHLYQYINAFRSQGGLKENLKIRNAALRAHCPDIDGRSK